jgi:hypothetical protein
MRPRPPLRRAAAAALALALLAASSAYAELFTLRDGTTVDGLKTRETAEFVWVRTLSGVRKIPVGDIESREPTRSPYEEYGLLKRAAEKAPKDVEAQWNFFAFLHEHAEPSLAKETEKQLERVFKLDPDHEPAHKAAGHVKFEGKWVQADDLERLKAEAARNKLRREWEEKLGLKVEMFESEHFLMLDETEEKDLPGRAKMLEDAHQQLAELLDRERLWKGRMVVITVKEYDDYLDIVERFAKPWGASPDWLKAVRREDQGGLWRDSPYPVQLRWPSSGDEGMWAAIIHNTSHVTIWTRWKNRVPPNWLEEGLGVWVELQVTDDNIATCFGGSASKKGKTVVKKKKRRGKKGSVRETQSEWKERCIEAVGAQEFPSLRKFLRMRQGDYGPAEQGGSLALCEWLMSLGLEEFRKLITLTQIHSKDDPPWRETFEDWEVIEDAEKEFFLWVQTEW